MSASIDTASGRTGSGDDMPAVVRYAFRGSEILMRSDASRGPRIDALDCGGAAFAEPADRLDLPGAFTAESYPVGTEAPGGWEWLPFRSVINAVPEAEWLGVARAMALVNWRSSTRFCGRCGSPNGDKPDELARQCPSCGALSFPRISPAVLAVVTRGDRLLLARNVMHKTGIWSILAGFVEPGETFEDCVRRETREEVSIDVRPTGYLGSQPWPFPDQLMVGFSADWVSGELQPDGTEIAEAGWFGPDDHPPLPMPGSLSRRLIDVAFARMR